MNKLNDSSTKIRVFGHYARLLVDMTFPLLFFMRYWWKGKLLHFH